jgi:hypothetical protein
MDSAMVAVRQGAHDAQERVAGALPAIGEFMSRLVYTSCYGLSYGVVFPVMLVVRMMPKDNAMVHGLIDGAIAAREQVEGWGAGTMEEFHEVEESVDGESESPSEEATDHRRRGTRRGGSHKAATRSSRKR